MLANAIFCEDMLPEVAYCKLMWVLGKTKEMEKIKEMMLTNYVNEITKVTNPKTFLI
jgi:glutamyl-tRNA(Gln) amidotransferase subunit D